MIKRLESFAKDYGLYAVFVFSLVAMLGSLYFSNVMLLPPCILCWYQRIAMYPLVLIAAIGIWKDDKNAVSYLLPLTLIGFGISIYHNLLYYQILPESIQPCMFGVSCTTKTIEWFGFITIPLLALVGFALITATLLLVRRANRKV
jgi:disulfide bond formation protein DsbB